MINYNDGYFNFATLFRVYGSACYKATSFAAASCGIYLLMYYYGAGFDGPGGFVGDGLKQYELLDHPYPMSVIVTAFMFVLSAKVNFSYNRFWEACTSLHNMHAKWLDVGSTMAAFHMQSKEFDRIRPPSFGDHQHVGDQLGQKNRLKGNNTTEITRELTELTENPTFNSEESSRPPQVGNGKASKYRKYLNDKHKHKEGYCPMSSVVSINSSPSSEGLPYPDYKSKFYGKVPLGEKSVSGSIMGTGLSIGRSQDALPTLFLQEAAHLVSLLSAVALASMRCESDCVNMIEFVPNRRWPNYNSENDADMKKYGHEQNSFVRNLRYMFDVSRTKRQRSLYDAARPFPVIGGVSDREALMLRRARGPPAKVALVFLWLQEFVIREQIHGSLGGVAPPIVSRIPQYLSDGHMWYNSARKMSYIPFPFAHAQMATLFVLCSTVLMPCLMLSKTEVWFGLVLNFVTVLLFAGLNELSKELEYPFRSMPNDLPLNLFQAQFNEALVTTFAGFHPDSWWEIDGDLSA